MLIGFNWNEGTSDMTITRILAATSAIGLIATSCAASAQAGATSATPSTATTAAPAPALAQGATVYDPQGGTVGTVESMQGEFVVLATAKSKARLPKSSFGAGAKGPVIAMTATQLDQAAAQAAPAAGASASAGTAKPDVAKGAQVADTQGGAVGTIAEVDAQFATVTLTTGGKVRLPVTAFGAGENGGLRVAMTAAQLSAAASAAGGQTTGG